jgi:hypothetical protein
MSAVVLRCRACGTTQSHPGECDACFEGEVGYFCTNHTPGLWLDHPVCADCGAKFGEAPRRRPGPPPAEPTTVPARDVRRPDSGRPMPRVADPPPAGVRRPTPRAPDPEDPPAVVSLADLLARMSEERARRRYEAEEARRLEPTPEAAPGPSFLAGCLVRVVLFVLVLIALALGGLFLLMGGGSL